MFFERLKRAREASGLTIPDLEKKTGIGKRSIENYFGNRPSLPIVNNAVYMAKVLDITVEELVLGEEGREFVLHWAGRNGAQWEPPEHLKGLCSDLKKLDGSSLEAIHAAVKKILELRGQCKTDSEENPQASIA